ncbi:hypothetical protein GALMADRAFT_242670 [Galerina marginata CBS 339.88]|uniref:Uncharacterized protein n=1 Tax=Galerina marginata (strain CBS 339.88) TaxID=685588 RepID=A0A067TAX7_GALM3|nr:hypothetical protein GALMADRAFT_242670 [Galerina marginata CBS 339.88]
MNAVFLIFCATDTYLIIFGTRAAGGRELCQFCREHGGWTWTENWNAEYPKPTKFTYMGRRYTGGHPHDKLHTWEDNLPLSSNPALPTRFINLVTLELVERNGRCQQGSPYWIQEAIPTDIPVYQFTRI